MSWAPSADYFEDAMQSVQPEYDLVTEHYGRRPATLLGPLLNEVNANNNISYDIQELSDDDNDINREKQTLKMMRNLGIESSLGGHLTSKNTLPTNHTNTKIIHQKNFPILLDEEYFKFKSSSLSSVDSLAKMATNSSTSSEERSPLDEILGIDRKICDIPNKTLEEKYNEDFPDLQCSNKLKDTERFCTPKQLYNNKKRFDV